MSASREKTLRQGKQDAKNEKKLAELEKERKQRRKTKITGIVAVAFVAVLTVLLILSGTGLSRRMLTAAKVDGEKISAAELQYYYASNFNQTYNEMYQTYGEYVQYFMPAGLSYTRSTQYDETRTWHDFLLEQALDSVSGVKYYSELAGKEGYALTAEDEEQLAAALDTVRGYAKDAGVSVNKYLASSMGKGITMKLYERELRKSLLASSYRSFIYDSGSFTEDEISAEYDKNAADYDSYTVRVTTLYASDQPNYSEDDSSAAMGDLRLKATMAVDAIAKGGDYYETLRPYMPESSQDSFGENDSAAVTLRGDSMGELYADWAKADDRKSGDADWADSETGVTVVQFVSRDGNDYASRNFEAVVYPVQISGTDFNSEEAYSEALTNYVAAVAAKFADFDYDPASGDVTAFKAAADKFAEADSSVIVQTCEDTLKTDYTQIGDWLFDESRKPGDTMQEYLPDLGGYAMFCYAGEGRNARSVIADSELRDAAYNEWADGQEAIRLAQPNGLKYWSRLVCA